MRGEQGENGAKGARGEEAAAMAQGLVEFQRRLSERLMAAERERRAPARLGFVCCGEHWLIDLASLREARAAPEPERMVALRLAKPWIRGCASLGGRALTLVDLQAFMGGEPAPFDEEARALELAERFDAGCALLVGRVEGLVRMEGLRELQGEALRAAEAKAAGASWGEWSHGAWGDEAGRVWRELDIERLADSPDFWSAWEVGEAQPSAEAAAALAARARGEA
jgi:chemotaxis signal transduction protein